MEHTAWRRSHPPKSHDSFSILNPCWHLQLLRPCHTTNPSMVSLVTLRSGRSLNTFMALPVSQSVGACTCVLHLVAISSESMARRQRAQALPGSMSCCSDGAWRATALWPSQPQRRAWQARCARKSCALRAGGGLAGGLAGCARGDGYLMVGNSALLRPCAARTGYNPLARLQTAQLAIAIADCGGAWPFQGRAAACSHGYRTTWPCLQHSLQHSFP